jgi:hypothetical protein
MGVDMTSDFGSTRGTGEGISIATNLHVREG